MIMDCSKQTYLMSKQKKAPQQYESEEKIMQEIKRINKKLVQNPFSSKHTHLISNLNDEKYFSQQCDELFKDNSQPSQPQHQRTFSDSLFNSKQQLLINDQYEKEIKNFKQFQTQKFISQKSPFASTSSKRQQIPSLSSKAALVSHSQALTKYPSKSKINDMEPITNQKPKSSTIAVSKPKSQSKTRNCISDKENITSNIQQSSFIKQVRSKIQNYHQPNQLQNVYQDQEDSLQFQHCPKKQIQQNKQAFQQYNQNNLSKSREKINRSKSSLECTFKPNLLKKSMEIADTLQPSFQRLTQDFQGSKSHSKIPYKSKQELSTKKYSVKRVDELSQPRKLKTMADEEEPKFDFRPTLSKKSLQQMANCTMDVASRNKLWLSQKQAKITKLRQQQEEKKLKKEMGPFAPKIKSYKGDTEVHLSRFAKQGMSNYFQRLSMAKQKLQIPQKKQLHPQQPMKQSQVVIKKKTYEEAVKELHQKIMNMQI